MTPRDKTKAFIEKTEAPTLKVDETRLVVTLYTIAFHDHNDFLEMCEDAPNSVLHLLYKTLTHPNPRHDVSTTKLNLLSADLVLGILTRRGFGHDESI